MTEIILSWREVDMAARDAVAEYFQSRRQGLQHYPEFDASNFWSCAIEGHCGEVAVAHYLNVYYVYRTGQYHAADVAGIQVKTRLSHTYELRVRPDDPDDIPFLLVTRDLADAEAVYRLHGWLYGREAKQVKWFRSLPGYTRKDFYAPQRALHPLETLPVVVRT